MNAIKQYRDKKKLTQKQLAEFLGWKHQSDVFYIEKRLNLGFGLKPEKSKELSQKLGIKNTHLLYPNEAL